MSIQLSDLKSQPLFEVLNEEELQQLCDAGVKQSYNKGEILIKEGGMNHYLFYLTNGNVEVRSYGVKIAKLSAGEMIGEVSAAGLGTPIADVIAAGSVTVYKFSVDLIQRISIANEAFGNHLQNRAMARVLC